MEKTEGSTIRELSKVWTPEAEWEMPQAPGEPVFLFPAFGPDTYDGAVGQVMANRERGANLARPEQSAFMLKEAYTSNDPAVKKSPRSEFVRTNIMRHGVLWVPTVNVWTPNGAEVRDPGMYAVSDENGQGLNKTYTIEELEDRLSGGKSERGVRFSQDRTVSFAPRNTIRAGAHKKGTLSQDGAFIAIYGVEGAEALDRVAEQFAHQPYSWTFKNDSDKPVQTLSALSGSRSLGDGGLGAGFSSGSYGGGYVVSVSGSKSIAEGDASKK